jgi:N-acetylated-alpha-linked acidic dipeptidase
MGWRWMNCRHWSSAIVLAVLPVVAGQCESEPAHAGALLGYSAAGSTADGVWERMFRAAISPDAIRDNMRRLSARPHHVGSPYDKDNAEWILAQFKSWGYDARIETFNVLFPTPKTRVLELLQPTSFRAALQESALASDPTSAQRAIADV